MIITITANVIIRHLDTPRGRKVYDNARQNGAGKYGALCCAARDALPFLDTDAVFEAAAEAQAVRNAQ
jgi:hypothetical protein